MRKALFVERQEYYPDASSNRHNISKTKKLAKPLVDGVMDLRDIGKNDESIGSKMTPLSFFAKYRLFALFLLIVALGIVGFWWYFDNNFQTDRPYEFEATLDGELPLLID